MSKSFLKEVKWFSPRMMGCRKSFIGVQEETPIKRFAASSYGWPKSTPTN